MPFKVTTGDVNNLQTSLNVMEKLQWTIRSIDFPGPNTYIVVAHKESELDVGGQADGDGVDVDSIPVDPDYVMTPTVGEAKPEDPTD